MIIDLPERFIFIGKNHNKNYAIVKEGILELHGCITLKTISVSLTYALKGKKKCFYCGKSVSRKKITVDHVYPQEFGGITISNNLVPSCSACNSRKSNMDLEQFKEYIEASIEERKNVKKKIKENQEYLRQNKGYSIPKEWYTTMKTTDIKVVKNIYPVEKGKKYQNVKEFYEKYGYFKMPLLVDRNNYLLDGFTTMLYAKERQIQEVPVVYLENVEKLWINKK